MNPMRYTPGDKLTAADQAHVLRAFVHRFTMEHVPRWARTPFADGRFPSPQFKSDAEWLERTSFATRKDGRLDTRAKFCDSDPTWPMGFETLTEPFNPHPCHA